MPDKKKKTDQQPEETEPYLDRATVLHGEFILFRNELIRPATGAIEDKKTEDKQARRSEEDGNR